MIYIYAQEKNFEQQLLKVLIVLIGVADHDLGQGGQDEIQVHLQEDPRPRPGTNLNLDSESRSSFVHDVKQFQFV